MLKTITSFNGHAINDGTNYRIAAHNSNNLPAADLVYIGQAQADSVDSGTYTVQPRQIALSIRIVNYVNRLNLVDQLMTWVMRGERGTLVATFADDG